jgi:hypothetical protein
LSLFKNLTILSTRSGTKKDNLFGDHEVFTPIVLVSLIP